MQTALGRAVLARGVAPSLDDLDLSIAERAGIARVLASQGFRLVTSIQRSWCEGRASKGAKFTLGAILPEERSRLICEWVDRGGGTNSFFFAEADGFLGYLAARLPDPSHALSICRFERAILRAAEAAGGFSPPDADVLKPSSLVKASEQAALVTFFGDVAVLLAATQGKMEFPPLDPQGHAVFVAPGLEQLARPVESFEQRLWNALALPVRVSTLESQGYRRDEIAHLMTIGAATLA